MWQLSRPKPALPNSYFWTWDHSTNWMLDDPGMLNNGCANQYLKRPDTYVEDYRRLTDLCAGLGIRGIFIWGFIRDSHGGIENSKKVASYAASKGVRILPGFGTTCYGGAYYEGDHPYNLETFVKNHPDARMLNEDGNIEPRGACASSPEYQDWLGKSIRWLFDEFEIGGVNIENGDFWVCHDRRCNKHKETWREGDPEFFRYQAMSYGPALEAVKDLHATKDFPWATYTGFLPTKGTHDNCIPYMQCERPALVDVLPEDVLCQWTITGMVLQQSLPLTAYLDDGAPDAAFDNPNWPRDLKPPTKRSIGFAHRPSQWSAQGRYVDGVSLIKEACLRSHRAGIEGVVIHGEVTSRNIPWALNYLAFSHFIHWPEDTIRDFGRKTLGQVLHSEDEGERFVEIFAHFDAKSLTDAHKDEARKMADELWQRVSAGHDLDRWRFWHWLSNVANGRTEPQTISEF